MKGTLHDPRKIFRSRNAVNPFAERPANFKLIAIEVKINIRGRVTTVVVGLNVSYDRNKRNRIEGRISNARDRIGEARTNVQQQNARLSRDSGVAVCSVSRKLLVAGSDETDPA